MPVALTVLLASPLTAEEWYVDAQAASCAAGTGAAATPFCRIELAVAAASDGDTIRIAPGTYRETLVIDEDLTLVGIAGEAQTVLDAENTAQDAVSVRDGADVTIRGLTIRNAGFYRAGIRIPNATPPSSLALSNSTVSNNQGGGIWNGNGVLTLTGTTIDNNRAQYGGGGILNSSGEVNVISSRVTNNVAYAPNLPYGGGIHSNGSLTVVDSVVDDNQTQTSFISGSLKQAYAGGIYNGVNGVAVLENTSVSGNAARVTITYIGNNASGGAILNRGQLTLEGCLLADNSAFPGTSYAPNARVIDSQAGELTLRGSTVAGAYGVWDPHFAVLAKPSAKILDTIVWGNEAPLSPGPQIRGEGGLPFVSHCDVQGGWEGPGGFNLNEDPQFTAPEAGDYSLQASSGLIDRGDPDAAPTGLDLGGAPRLNDGDLDRTLIGDIGAHEFSHVRLAVTGTAVPGGELTLAATGTAGLQLLLAIGVPAAGSRLDPFGLLFFDPAAPVRIRSLGTLPASTTLGIPPSVVGPVSVVLQLLALEPPGARSRRAGNVSNPVQLTIP